MGDLSVRLQQLAHQRKEGQLHPSEQRALQRTREEAKAHNARIENLYGGLPPSVALGIFRRDEWRCKRCGGSEHLGLHHKGGVKTSRHVWRGKDNSPPNLVVICKPCHNAVHTEDREKLDDDGEQA